MHTATTLGRTSRFVRPLAYTIRCWRLGDEIPQDRTQGGDSVTVMRPLGRVDLPVSTASVGQARAYVRGILTSRHQAVRDDVVLLVSELVANSVQYSDPDQRGDDSVTLVVCEPGTGVLRIEVSDAGSAASRPQPRLEVDVDSEGGRGLLLVDALAEKWGWHETSTGRMTWFELAVPDVGHGCR